MKKFFVTLLMAGLMLTGAAFSVSYEPVSAVEAADISEPIPVAANAVKASGKGNYIFVPVKDKEPVAEPSPMVAKEDAVKESEPEATVVSQSDIELIALCVMAEAEGESEYGQRLVIDTILNRVDDPHFPDTVYDVIYQKNQFSGMYGERIKRCYVKDELVQLVREELESRTNYDVVFFRTGHYHSYGVPMFQVGAHYFSSYD